MGARFLLRRFMAFDTGGLVGLLARHAVVDWVVRQEEAACTAVPWAAC